MKIYLLLTALVFSLTTFSQESNQVIAPVIVSKIPLGDCIKKEAFKITFAEVVSDSRCPSDVTCVWEGEAELKMVVEVAGKSHEKMIVFRGAYYGNEKDHVIFEDRNRKIIARYLHPYPLSNDSGKRDYVLEVYEKLSNPPSEE